MTKHSLIQKLDKHFLNCLEMVPHAIGILDLNGYLVFINRYFEKMYAVKKEQVEGRHISVFYNDKAEQNRTLAYISKMLSGEVLPGKFLDKSDYPGNSTYQDILWDYLKIDDKTEGFIYTSTNNDSKEIFERQLNESKNTLDLQNEIVKNLKKKMRMALEAVNEGIWEWDLVTDTVQYDDRYFEMLGYTREALKDVGNIWRYLVHPDDIDDYNKRYEEFLQKGEDRYELRYRFKTAADEWIWILDKGQVVSRDETGMPTRIIGIHVDISEIMKKNEELEKAKKHTDRLNIAVLKANKDLKYTQKLLEYVLKNAGVGIWRWDFLERSTYYDVISCDIFGFDPSYPNGETKLFSRILPDDRDIVLSIMKDYREGLIPDYDIRYRVVRPDSHVIWIQEKGEIVEFDKEDIPKLFIGSIRDITAQKEFEELLIKARNDAQRANNMKTELIANVNHELRTPLTIISGAVETLLDIEQDSEKKRFLNKILASSNRLMHLIKDVLDLSNIENGHLKLKKTTFDIRDFLADYFIGIAYQAEKKSLESELDVNETVDKMVYMDKPKLRQILNNLFSNALKFTLEGEIGLKVSSDAKKLHFEVYDTGIGIPKEKRTRVFDRFYQIDASSIRNFSGTGLGLSIVKELVERMDGAVVVEAYKAGGTKFVVSLPYKKEKASL